MDLNLSGSKTECYICKRSLDDIKNLFEAPVNKKLIKKHQDLTNYYNEILRLINLILSPIKNWLFQIKSGLLKNKYSNFSIQTILNEYETLKGEIPRIIEFLVYFGVDFSDRYYHQKIEKKKVKSLLKKFEKDLESLEKLIIPTRLLEYLHLTNKKYCNFQYTSDDNSYYRNKINEDLDGFFTEFNIKIKLQKNLKKYEKILKNNRNYDDYEEEIDEKSPAYFDNFSINQSDSKDKNIDTINANLSIKQKSALISLYKMRNILMNLMKKTEPISIEMIPFKYKKKVNKYNLKNMEFSYFLCPVCASIWKKLENLERTR